MPVEVRVPATGESVAEVTVGAWFKREGERVEAGEALVELETDKVNLEVAAERAGVLRQIRHQEGASVQPGDVLAIIATADEQPTEPAPAAPAEAPAPAAARAEAPPAPPEPEPAPAAERPQASPLARRVAEEHGVDLAQVPGSGAGGRVTREDVERFVEAGGPPTPPAPPAPPERPAAPPAPPAPAAAPAPGARPEERRRLSRRRLTIAQRLLEAQRTAAMLTTFNEADLGAVQELRARRRAAFRERHGVDLGLMSFFARATVVALQQFPLVNAEIQGEEVVLKRYYDIGIAVGAEEGLVVPIVRDADRKSFAQLEREIQDLAARARENRLTLDDLRGGTFTITNGGVFGSLLSTPILSPPQVGILGLHRIEQRPVARDGQVVIRPMMYLALTYDHRLIDGREAVQFLGRIKQLIEEPLELLLES